MIQRLFLLLPLVLPLSPASAAELRVTFVGASDVALENPHDLKLSPDGRHLFVSDVGHDRIAVLDPETLALVWEFGADHQSGTHDIDFDAAGRAYVADTHNNRVTVYEFDGHKAELVGQLDARIRGPEGVLAHPNGRIYVAGAWSGNLVVYQDGTVIDELHGLSSPHDVEITPEGDIWLADAGADRMLLLSPDLEKKRELKGSPYNFDGVRYQDVLPDGTLIAADKNNHQVKIIGPDGNLLLTLGTGRSGRGPGQPSGSPTLAMTVW
jgi:DNA-binding beta-propeller fold protein YncE